MRRYDKGVLVGDKDPPLDFEQWLNGEIAQAEAARGSCQHSDIVSINARITALHEVRRAYRNSKGDDGQPTAE